MEKVKAILSAIFLSKRAKSFYWRAGGGVVLGFVAYLLDILPELGLGEYGLAVATLLLNEFTKYLNKKGIKE